jgi:SAM-dependent methyltransferase
MKFKDALERWNERYRQAEGFLFGDGPNRWLAHQVEWLDRLAAAPRVRGEAPRGLSVADGEGRNSVWLAGRGWSVDAFDFSPIAVQRARQFAAARTADVNFSIADLADANWPPERYQAVIAIFFQFASPELRAAAFSGMARALEPGGLLVIEGYGLRQLQYRTGGPGVAENLYTLPMLLAAFDGWPTLASRDADVDLVEGTGHVGRSHVVSLVLRKPERR